VVVGTEKAKPSDSQKHYVLLIAPTHPSEYFTEFERVGVAILKRKNISLHGPGLKVQIV
jgi:hypothetical protein